MKKTVLALALFAGSFSVMAQDSLSIDNSTKQDTTVKPRMMDEAQVKQTSVGNYQAFGNVTTIPGSTQRFFNRDFPEVTGVTWQQSGNWYRATYLQNNRNMQVYYAPNGDNYALALPVIQSWVPEEVITSALNNHGNDLYAINKVRGANGKDVYQATTIEGGMTSTVNYLEDGSTVLATDVFRTDAPEIKPDDTMKMEEQDHEMKMEKKHKMKDGKMKSEHKMHDSKMKSKQKKSGVKPREY